MMNWSFTPRRILSVDALRGLTMMMMLFVNDIPSLRDIPQWLLHAATQEDRMGFSDLVFPCFLFCVGMSVPLSVEQRRQVRGESDWQIAGHVLKRTLVLLALGLLTLNNGGVEEGLSYAQFNLLMVVGVVLTWGVHPSKGRWRRPLQALNAVGVVMLVSLVVYKDLHGQPFEVGWWGILGLIGWTYAVCATVYLMVGQKRGLIPLLAIVAILLAVGNRLAFIPHDWASRVILLPFIPGGWTHHALGMCGMAAVMMMQHCYAKGKHLHYIVGLLVGAVVMLGLGMWAHEYWIISKNMATPTWLFFCISVFLPVLALFYWLTEVKGLTTWTVGLKPAATATLTCYMLPYGWYALQGMMGWSYPELLQAGGCGLLRSMLFAVVICLITEMLGRIGVKLKI